MTTTTWITRFAGMELQDALLTITEDPSTLSALIAELQAQRNPPGQQANPTLAAARAVIDTAADEVLVLRAKLRDCNARFDTATTDALAHEERYRELRAELESALDRIHALRDNEAILLRQLSDALTGGNASTWDEVLHAATVRAESTADLREAAGALDGFADRSVNPDAVPRLRELAQACRRAALATPPAPPAPALGANCPCCGGKIAEREQC